MRVGDEREEWVRDRREEGEEGREREGGREQKIREKG